MHFWEVVNTLSRVTGSENFLLHCKASSLVLEILKRGKIWGTICIRVPPPNSKGLVYP